MALIIIGVIFIVVGVVTIFMRKSQEDKIYQMKLVDTKNTKELTEMSEAVAKEVGGGGYHEICEVKGILRCDNPLTSELAKEPCVYYTTKVERKWEEEYYETNSEGKRERKMRKGTDTVSSNTQMVEFWVEDETGKVKVAPTGAEIDTVKVVDKFEPGEQASSGGEISFGGISFKVSAGQSGRRTLGYHYEEKILPLDRRLYVLGEASDSSGEVRIQKPTEKGNKFLISLKTEEELVSSAESSAKTFKIVSMVSFAIGVILILIGIIK